MSAIEDWMSVAAVVVTFLAALVGWQASRAIGASTAAGVQAERFAIKAVQVGADADDAAQLQYSRFTLLESQRRRLGNAWQARGGDGRAGERDVERLEHVAAQTLRTSADLARGQTTALRGTTVLDPATILGRRLCPITPLGAAPPAGCGPGNGPEQDPAFPRNHFADAGWQAARLTALRDAAAAASSEKGREVAAYTVSLSTFSVAIFLFGFAVSPHADRRRPFAAWIAGALTAFFLAYSAWAFVRYDAREPPSYADDAPAATHYADGVVALARGDAARARGALDRAVEAWPGFGRALYQRARAHRALGVSIPSSNGAMQLLSGDALQAEIRDLQKARRTGLDLADASIRLAAALVQRGIATHDEDVIRAGEEALAADELATARAGGDPLPDLIRGLARLALGDADAARRAYVGAMSKASTIVVGGRRLKRDPQRVVAGALTGLELLATSAPPDRRLAAATRRSVDAMKELVVATAGGARVAAPGSLLPPGVTLHPGGARITFRSGAADDLVRSRISAQWYRADATAGGWTVLPELSGAVDLEPAGPGVLTATRSFLKATARATTPTCLPPGRYRLELYRDGRLVERVSAALRGPRTVARFNREMNIALCTPEAWSHLRRVEGMPFAVSDFPASIAGWTGAHGREGVLLVRLNGRFSLRGVGGRERPREAAQTAAEAVRIWSRAFPAPPRPRRTWTTGTLDVGFSDNPGIEREFVYGGGRDSRVGQGGMVEVQATYNRNDLAFVIAVYGPRATRTSREPLLASVTSALA